MNDENLQHDHHTQEWDLKAAQDITAISGHHQKRRDNSTNISRQWNECLKENWWKDNKITVMGEHIWKITTGPQYRLSTTKCNMLKIDKAPKKDHGRAMSQKHLEKYSKEEIDWNDAHHSHLIWQLATLRTSVQTLLTVIARNPARDHNSIATNCNHIEAVVLLPYEAIIKAPEIATFLGEQTLSPSNGSERAITDRDTCLALSPHKGLCKQPMEGQMMPSRHQWTSK